MIIGNYVLYNLNLFVELTHLVPATTQPHHLSMFCMMQLMKTTATSTAVSEERLQPPLPGNLFIEAMIARYLIMNKIALTHLS